MTIGDSIIWSTLLLIIAGSFFWITKSRRWITVGKLSLVLLGIVICIGTGTWAFSEFQSRPQASVDIDGVKLGMTETEVKLSKGAPKSEIDSAEGNQKRKIWQYDESGSGLYVYLYPQEAGTENHVEFVCKDGGYGEFLNFSPFISEEELIKKIGTPSNTSINSDGLRKLLSFKKWNAAFEIEKARVAMYCLTQSGVMTYSDEK